jgi:hypothetical protein
MTAARVQEVPALPVSKLARIRYLLDHWEDIFDPGGTSAFGSPGDGSGSPMMPLMSRHRSVLELERCLRVLAVEAPSQLSHLKAYHCAEWRIRVDHVRVKRPRRQGGKAMSELVETRTRERIVPSWVRLEKVRRAEDRLVVVFRGRVEIPEDLSDALLLSADEVEAKRRKRVRARMLRGAA